MIKDVLVFIGIIKVVFFGVCHSLLAEDLYSYEFDDSRRLTCEVMINGLGLSMSPDSFGTFTGKRKKISSNSKLWTPSLQLSPFGVRQKMRGLNFQYPTLIVTHSPAGERVPKRLHDKFAALNADQWRAHFFEFEWRAFRLRNSKQEDHGVTKPAKRQVDRRLLVKANLDWRETFEHQLIEYELAADALSHLFDAIPYESPVEISLLPFELEQELWEMIQIVLEDLVRVYADSVLGQFFETLRAQDLRYYDRSLIEFRFPQDVFPDSRNENKLDQSELIYSALAILDTFLDTKRIRRRFQEEIAKRPSSLLRNLLGEYYSLYNVDFLMYHVTSEMDLVLRVRPAITLVPRLPDDEDDDGGPEPEFEVDPSAFLQRRLVPALPFSH